MCGWRWRRIVQARLFHVHEPASTTLPTKIQQIGRNKVEVYFTTIPPSLRPIYPVFPHPSWPRHFSGQLLKAQVSFSSAPCKLCSNTSVIQVRHTCHRSLISENDQNALKLARLQLAANYSELTSTKPLPLSSKPNIFPRRSKRLPRLEPKEDNPLAAGP